MTLLRPPMANFKMTVRADYAVSACSPPCPPPLPIKSLVPLGCQWGESAPGQMSALPQNPPVASIWNKANSPLHQGFPDSSAGKESACNAANPGLISGFGRSPGEGIGYPLQYSWASLVAQLVKNLPAMRETWLWFLDWEDPLEKGKAAHSSILVWRILWSV